MKWTQKTGRLLTKLLTKNLVPRNAGSHEICALSSVQIPCFTGEMSCSKSERGCCLWLTGLPGSGKTTLASTLAALLEARGQTTTVLDGDVVRSILCPDLGYSRQDRRSNLMRIAFVAKEIVRHGGFVICATISPYREDRQHIRSMFGEFQFVEVYVATPLQVCESRDAKGLYARARRGEIREFTGISAPYEPPVSPDVVCDMASASAEQNANRILPLVKSIPKSMLEGSLPIKDGLTTQKATSPPPLASP